MIKIEFKNVVKKIMGSKNLKSKLKNTKSSEEVYKLFKESGYQGSEQELNKHLFGKKEIIDKITECKLENVAGGISGRQALATCAGIMMLTNTLPIANINTTASASSATSYSSEYSEELSHEQLLNLEKSYALYSICFQYSLIVGNDLREYDSKKANQISMFFAIECLKHSADILGMLSNNDYTGYKNELDSLLLSTDFDNYDDQAFNAKLDNINSNYGLGDNQLDDVDGIYGHAIDSNEKKSRISWFEKKSMLRSLKTSLEDYQKLFKLLSNFKDKKQEINSINEYMVEILEKYVDSLRK